MSLSEKQKLLAEYMISLGMSRSFIGKYVSFATTDFETMATMVWLMEHKGTTEDDLWDLLGDIKIEERKEKSI